MCWGEAVKRWGGEGGGGGEVGKGVKGMGKGRRGFACDEEWWWVMGAVVAMWAWAKGETEGLWGVV